MIKLTEEQIIDGQNEAYLKAGYNAYFGNGFNAGVEFALKEVNKLHISDVVERSEQLVTFLKWVGDGYDFENNAEKIVKKYIEEGN